MTTTSIIQIKICADYRDMLPRPRLVSKEPWLRPISRSPCVPDKSSRGLGSMSWYSAPILICFIAYIFIYSFLWGLVGNLYDCLLQLSIVIRMKLVIRQSKLPACLAEVQLTHENTSWHSCHRTGEIDRLKLMKSVSMGRFQYNNQVKTDFRSFGIRSSRVVLKIN